MELGSSGRRCERVGMEERELWSRAAGVQTWRYGARELWRRADVDV